MADESPVVVAKPAEAVVDSLPGEPTEAEMDAALSDQGPYGAKRAEMESESDGGRVTADVVMKIIGNVEEDARQAMGGKPKEPEKVDAEGKPVEAKPVLSPVEERLAKLEAELASTKESAQKRIDEITAEKRKAQEEAKKADPNRPKSIQDLSPEQLEGLWLTAEQRQYGAKKDEVTGDTLPGDPVQNLRLKLKVEAEMRRRDIEAESQPVKAASELKAAHAASMEKALQDKDLRKYFHKAVEKDGKAVEVFDDTLPVVKLANQKLREWEKDEPTLYQRKDAPMRAAKEALAELSAGADVKMARELHRLQLEVQDLRGRTGIDGGRPGGNATVKKAEGEEMGDESYDSTRRKSFAGATGL